MLYPLRFESVYKSYLWGGRNLEKLNKTLPKGLVSESWEIASHRDGESIVANGEFIGMTLSELIKKLGSQLIGKYIMEKYNDRFPFLVKYIDANDKLSVQVHPKDDYAFLNEDGDFGKSEMWYIFDTKTDAKLLYGLKKGVTRETFIKAIEQGTFDECMNYITAQKGKIYNVPAGLLHAIGEGIIVIEIQQNSNATYRVYDYDRCDNNGKRRELHIQKALEVIDFDNCGIDIDEFHSLTNEKEDILLETEPYVKLENSFFYLEKEIITGSKNFQVTEDKFNIIVFIEGEGFIQYGNGEEAFIKGDTFLIPAALRSFTIKGDAQILLVEAK